MKCPNSHKLNWIDNTKKECASCQKLYYGIECEECNFFYCNNCLIKNKLISKTDFKESCFMNHKSMQLVRINSNCIFCGYFFEYCISCKDCLGFNVCFFCLNFVFTSTTCYFHPNPSLIWKKLDQNKSQNCIVCLDLSKNGFCCDKCCYFLCINCVQFLPNSIKKKEELATKVYFNSESKKLLEYFDKRNIEIYRVIYDLEAKYESFELRKNSFLIVCIKSNNYIFDLASRTLKEHKDNVLRSCNIEDFSFTNYVMKFSYKQTYRSEITVITIDLKSKTMSTNVNESSQTLKYLKNFVVKK